jgi:hypothetical protein
VGLLPVGDIGQQRIGPCQIVLFVIRFWVTTLNASMPQTLVFMGCEKCIG